MDHWIALNLSREAGGMLRCELNHLVATPGEVLAVELALDLFAVVVVHAERDAFAAPSRDNGVELTSVDFVIHPPHEVELILLEEPLPGSGLVAGELDVLEIGQLSIRGNATQ